MNTFIITEKNDVNSTRDGEEIQAKTLADAKRTATRRQLFQGTVMTVENEAGVLLAVKEEGVWRNKPDAYLYK